MLFRSRYKQLARIGDLEEAITCHRQAIALRPHGHPNLSDSLNNLANAVSIRFQQLGRIEDLKETITCHRQAITLRPHGHPNRSYSLNNLAISLPCPIALSSWGKWLVSIWRRRSHVSVKRLLSNLTDIPIVRYVSITSPMPCPLALNNQGATMICSMQSSMFLKPRIYCQLGIHANQ